VILLACPAMHLLMHRQHTSQGSEKGHRPGACCDSPAATGESRNSDTHNAATH
jgi:hypothetical protein